MPKRYPIFIPLRLLAVALTLLFWVFPILLVWGLRLRGLHEIFIHLSCASIAKCLGLRVTVKGAPARERPLLMVSNHFSYLDVYVLGGLLAVHFTPKREVASWPLIGFCCRCIGCIFIDRRVSQTKNNHLQLIGALKHRWVISLFPEGTTNNGMTLLPFRSSYFSLAEAPYHVPVQPVTVRYTHIGGESIRPQWLPLIGWYADMTFFPHFLQVLALPSIRVEVQFHPLLKGEGNRKMLAEAAQRVIERGLGH